MSVNILFPTCQLLEALYIYCICKHTAHTTVHAVDMCNSYMPWSIYFQIARVRNSLFRSFALSLIRSSLFRSSLFHTKLFILKSDRKWFTFIALYKRATVSKSLMLLFKKSHASDSLFCSQEKSDLLKIFLFFNVFDSFSLFFSFLCPRVNWSHRSSLRRSFAHKKQAILSKNQRANSQPCKLQIIKCTSYM